MSTKFRHVVDKRNERGQGGNLGRQSQKKAPEARKPVSLPALSILEIPVDLVDGYYSHQADTAARALGLVPERGVEDPRLSMKLAMARAQ